MKHKAALKERQHLHDYEHGDCDVEMVYLYTGFWDDVKWTVNYCPRCDQIICCVGGGIHNWNYTSANPQPENLEAGRKKAKELDAMLSVPPVVTSLSRSPGYWQSGEDWWAGDEVENGYIPSDAQWHQL